MKKQLWMDLEMTGLDENIHKIIEIAAIVTDVNGKPLDEYHQVVYQPKEALDLMDDWCVKTHGSSGLTEQIPNGKPLEEVEEELVKFLSKNFERNQRPVLAGNSIWNDRKFIDKYLPRISKRLHYRMIDVSSFKEVFREKWGLKVEKNNSHRATDDILDSIKELKEYLTYVDEQKIQKAVKVQKDN